MELIKKYVNKNVFSYLLSVIFAILGVVMGLITYIILAKLVVLVVSGNMDISFYTQNIIFILGAFVLKEVFAGISTLISHTATFKVLADMRKDIMGKLFKMPLGDILNYSTGKLKDIIVDQVDHMETSLAHIIPEVTANLVGPIVLLGYMLILDWRLMLLSLIPLVIGFGAMATIMNESYQLSYKKSVEIGQKMNNSVVEYINGVEVIKAFNQSDSSYEKYSKSVYDNASFFYNWMKSCSIRSAMGMHLSPMGLLTILPFSVIFYLNGSLNVVNLIAIIILSFGTIENLIKISAYIDDLARIGTITGEIQGILSSKELIHSNSDFEIKNFDIDFENVSFAYNEDKQILEDLSLNIKENRATAFVGPSGSGKSTITKLIAGFWDIDKGDIKIGGVSLKDISLKKLSDLISYVSQDNFLFDISIKENIRIAKPDATDEEIVEMAKKSGCHEFIINLENGYDTIVGEGGSHLSGGERQRISIARAMLKNAPIVILDEATSYIDAENESIIQESISNLVKGKTLIMIAHRLRTVTNVDEIFVIENGKINSKGTHNELIENSKLYKEMWDSAIKGEE